MKRFYMCALAAIALCGCQTKELEPDCKVVDKSPTLTATIEDDFSDGTKTSLDEYGNVLWKQGDQISAFLGSTINQQYQVTDDSDGKTSAELYQVSSKLSAGTEISNNVAFYPYQSTATIAKNESAYVISDITLPATQTYAANSFGNGAFPMAAVTGSTTDMNLKFKNVLGGLKLQLTGTANIASISVTGNNDEILCGSATVTSSNGSTPSINLTDASAKTVTLNCGSVALDETTPTSFIIALPPMTMTGGFTVIVTDTESKQMEIKTTKSQTIARSGILKMPAKEYIGKAPAPEYVDLGLTFKWATCNVGASKPEEYGGLYQWAGLEDVSSSAVNWSNCPYHTGAYYGTGWTKYNSTESYGTVDNLYTIEANDDVANVSFGGYWRIPTVTEWGELSNTANCSWTWTQLNGVNGYKVQSKKEGYTDNWIFLPAAGYRLISGKTEGGSEGCYWSSTRYSSTSPHQAYYISFSEGNKTGGGEYRYEGRSIRPIWGEIIPVSDVTIEQNISMMLNTQTALVATISPSNATNKKVTWTSSNSNVVTVSSSGLVTAISIGSATITVKTNDGGLEASCNVTVTPEYIDLGLPSGTLWSTCNRGAKEPWQEGYFFSYNLTTGYYYSNLEEDSEGSYYWCNWNEVTSYNDDGGCIPTKEQFEELINTSYTTIERITKYGDYNVSGLQITSKANGKSIFLIEAGEGDTSTVSLDCCCYWTCSTEGLSSAYAYDFYSYAYSPSPRISYSEKTSRLSVRPVK